MFESLPCSAAPSGHVPAAGHPASEQRSSLRFAVHRARSSERSRVQAFVQSIYRARYGATIGDWAPVLVGLWCDGELVAAAGYRRAKTPLFLERYLSGTIDDAIAERAGIRVPRHAIFEVGHFAAARAGAGRVLMRVLADHLATAGCRWVAMTATRELRHLFARLRLSPLTLAPADPSRLGTDAARWGSYYAHSPAVLAGDLAQGLAIFARAA
jgi:hypothetical protein